MLSDAVAAGKPVGLIPLKPDGLATFLRFAGEIRGRPFRMRRLDQFWNDLRARGLVGTLEEPRSGRLDSCPMDTAVAAVRALLGDAVPEQVEATQRPSPKPVRKPAAL